MFEMPCTSTGTSDLPPVVLMPSLPKPPEPHVHTVPSDLRTIVPRAPPHREITSGAAKTGKFDVNKSPAMVASLILIGSLFRRFHGSLFVSGHTQAVKGRTPAVR